MNTKVTSKRYTLTLPAKIHEELTAVAIERGVTGKEIVLKCLKLGLLAISLDNNPNKELVIKEMTDNNEIKETKILLI